MADLVVQSVPCGHPYVTAVRSALADAGAATTFLPDPPAPGAPPGQWWPHPALEPGWATAARGHVDLVHLQFGFEGRSPAELTAWIESLHASGISLVHTVHDLVDPHAADDARYAAKLDVLLQAADALTTLTEGAAREVASRCGRSPIVHPHPNIVEPAWADAPRIRSTGRIGPTQGIGRPAWTVSVHLKSLRANVDLDVVDTLLDAVGEMGGATLRLHVHPEVLDPTDPRHRPALAARLAVPPAGVDVRVHPALTDEELWADLLDADLAVLPYSRSTHSGWLEMCHALGTPVLAPDLGHLADQRPVRTWVAGDLDDLRAALGDARRRHVAGERPARPDSSARAADAAKVADAHRRAYAAARAAARVRAGSSSSAGAAR